MGRLTVALAVVSAVALVGPSPIAGAATGSPFGGTAAAIPGTVQAENYDTGGQGVAYNVAAVNGSADSYRPDGVDRRRRGVGVIENVINGVGGATPSNTSPVDVTSYP